MAALDMAAMIHMVKPGTKTHNFKDYAHLNVIPFLKSQLTIMERIDSILESYGLGSLSLKSGTRIKRGGTFTTRTCVGPAIPIPKGKSWHTFFKDSEN